MGRLGLRNGLVAIACLWGPLASGQGEGETMQWPVHWMCAEAEGIVIGERIGPNQVRVEDWMLRPPAHGVDVGENLEILGLENHWRVAESSRGEEEAKPRRLSSQRMLCFLQRKGNGWYALIASGEGSAGLVWLEEGRCYRYFVMAGEEGRARLAADPAVPTESALREQVARGLADRREWERALEIIHPVEQAVVMTSYLLPRTSPEGSNGTYRNRVRTELPKLGDAAVGELIELLRGAEPGDDLGTAVMVLGDLGPVARPALPELADLLAKPTLVHPALVLQALGRMEDPRVAPRILPFLDHDQLMVRAEAAKALAVFRYHDAAGDIAAALPAEVGPRDAYHVYQLLGALAELDPEAASRLTSQYIERPAMTQLRNLLEPLLAP